MLSFTRSFDLKGCSGTIEVSYSANQGVLSRVHLGCVKNLKGSLLSPFDEGPGRSLHTNNYLVPIDDIISASSRLTAEARLFDLVSSAHGKFGLKVNFWICANALISIYHQNGNKVFLFETFSATCAPGSSDSRQILDIRGQSDLVDLIRELGSFAQDINNLLTESAPVTSQQLCTKPAIVESANLDGGGSSGLAAKIPAKRGSKRKLEVTSTLPVWPITVSEPIAVE